jgi:hypothetical protein
MSICLYFQRSCLPHCLVVIPCSNVYLSVFPEIMSPPLSCSNSMFECLFVCISRDHVFHIVLWSFHVRMYICLYFQRSCLPHRLVIIPCSNVHRDHVFPHCLVVIPCSNVHLSVFLEIMSSLLSCSHSMFEYPFVCISRVHVFHVVL